MDTRLINIFEKYKYYKDVEIDNLEGNFGVSYDGVNVQSTNECYSKVEDKVLRMQNCSHAIIEIVENALLNFTAKDRNRIKYKFKVVDEELEYICKPGVREDFELCEKTVKMLHKLL